MRIPSRAMIALRTLVTLELSAVIAQAGFAAAYLGRSPDYLRAHEIGASVTFVLCMVVAVAYVVLRRAAGTVNVTLAVLVATAVVVQYALGEAKVVDAHVFLGVLIAMLITALTSWTYRHDDGGAPAFEPDGRVGRSRGADHA